jgi:hypothetical protein
MAEALSIICDLRINENNSSLTDLVICTHLKPTGSELFLAQRLNPDVVATVDMSGSVNSINNTIQSAIISRVLSEFNVAISAVNIRTTKFS